MANETGTPTEPTGNGGAPLSTTRRRFLTGAGIGVVAGAAVATGAIALTKPEFAGTTATTTKTEGTSASVRKVTLILNGVSTPVLVDVRSSLWDVMTYQLGLV